MGDGVFNIAKGRVGEFFNRVDANDPATATLKIVVLKAAGLEADDTLNNYDTLADVLAAANDEATNTGYARLSLSDSDIAMGSPDDTNNRFDYDIPDPAWSNVQATGGAWGKLLVCYDPNSSADSAIIPLTFHDFAVTPDGTNITGTVASTGFFRSS